MDYLKDGNDYFCSKERKLTLKQGQWLAKWDQLSQDWVLGQSVSVLSQVPVSAPHFPPQWLVAIITGDIQNSSHLGALNLHLPRACSVLTQRAGRGRSEDFGKGERMFLRDYVCQWSLVVTLVGNSHLSHLDT